MTLASESDNNCLTIQWLAIIPAIARRYITGDRVRQGVTIGFETKSPGL